MLKRIVLVAPILGLLLLMSCVTHPAAPTGLPFQVDINKDAGHGGTWVIVTLRLESGEELPFLVDTGASGTMLDKSLEPKLGKRLGDIVYISWGTRETNAVFEAPRLCLGGAILRITDNRICTQDCQPLSKGIGRPVMGVLGMDIMEHYCIQFDFSAGKMRFLEGEPRPDWGKAFPIIPLNARDSRPAVAQNLLGEQGPHSLIDSGCDTDGWLMPKYFQQWTNRSTLPAKGQARSPEVRFDGQRYPLAMLMPQNVESDGIGIRFLSRHLVTLDFPRHTLYLQRQSIGPLPDPRLKATPMPSLDQLIGDLIQQDTNAVLRDLAALEQSRAGDLEKSVARRLAATMSHTPKPSPAEAPAQLVELPLGDARAEASEVGWLEPAANRIPLNGQILSPLLDSGEIHATGLYAHAPSHYVYDLAGQWKTLRGQAGLHTAFQGHAYGVIFIIKTDGKEVFRSSAIRGSEHASYEVDLTGVNKLELQVDKAQDQNGGNWALWLDPTLLRAAPSGQDSHQ